MSDASTIPGHVTSTSGSVQAGTRIVRHVMVFGEFGRFGNLQPESLQGTVDSTVAALLTGAGLDLVGTSRMPANYEIGGVRVGIPTHSRVLPYVLSGMGGAQLSPSARFTYADGLLPTVDPTIAMPALGQDVTSDIVSAGDFAQPASSSAFMFSVGAGAQVAIARHWMADAGYRYSHISTDTPLHTQGMTFGFGYRF
jgi:hypothetical protein